MANEELVGKPTPIGGSGPGQKAEASGLPAAEETYREILDDLPALLCRFLPDGTITFVNEAYCRYFDRTREELLGTDFRLLIPEAERAQVMDRIKALSAAHPTQAHEHPVLGPHGEVRWQRWTNRILLDDSGRPRGYQSIGEDVTDRRRGAEILNREQNTLQGLLEGLADSGIAVHVLTSDHKVLLENDAVVGRFGSALGKKCFEHYRGRTAVCPECKKGEALATGRLVSAEIVGGDGRNYRVFTAPLSRKGAKTEEVMEIALDITEQKRAEGALRDSELRHRSLMEDVLDTSAAGIVILDRDFRVVWINQAYERFFGLLRGAALGQDKRVLIDERAPELFADASLFTREMSAAYEDHAQVHRFECHVRPAGEREERWLELSSSPIDTGLFAGGRIEHYYDISPRKRAEAERLDLERRMQHRQKLESLGLMAGGVAHDFNNLLMTILGNADLALQDTPEDAPAYDKIREVEYGAQRAAELAGQLLSYSGRGRFVTRPVSLSDLVRGLEPMLRISASRKVTFTLELDDDLPLVQGDPAQFQQIAINLVTNAAEAIGDQDGSLSIRTGAVESEAPGGAANQDEGELAGRHVFLEVRDTGCGMDEHTVHRIFDPFFTTKFTGRGLGMAAVMGIVRDHQGTIDIQSAVDEGTTIRVLFPMASADAVTRHVAQRPPARNGGRRPRRVLLVDDERDVRVIAQSMIERFGLEVLTAGDGYEAVEVFRKRADDIDCVLLDLTMPRMDGEATFHQMRAIRKDACIVLTSGYSEQDVGDRFADGALAGFIQKPYCSASLKAVLERALGC